MSLDHQKAAEVILQAMLYQQDFPDDVPVIANFEEAYEVQFDILQLQQQAGQRHAGWKVGLTAKAMQEQQGVHEPVFGHLLASGQVQSPATITFDSMLSPGFENELCLRLKSALAGPDVTFEEAARAIDAVAPAVEIIEKRGVLKASLALGIAANAQQRFFITGEFVPFHPDIDLAAVEVSVGVNGQTMETAFGKEVLGNPVHSVAWLARKLSEYDRQLHPGDLIMTGSFTKQYDLNKGDKIAIAFSGIGSAEAHFS